ncbi:MAG TPA: hypothetical protein VIU62_12430 [Chloroflexota bacterium]
MVGLQTPVALLSAVSEDGTVNNLTRDLVVFTTEKHLSMPAGTWSATLTGTTDARGRTWADRLLANDYVESRLGYRGVGQTPRIHMRCLIDNTDEDVATINNEAQRVVILNGRDLGKGLLTKDLWTPSLIDPVLNQDFNWWWNFELSGQATTPQQPSAWIAHLAQFYQDTIGNAQALGQANAMIQLQQTLPMRFVCQIPDQSAYAVWNMNWDYPVDCIWNMLTYLQAAPFSEMFMRDEEAGPVFYWRFPPFYDVHGTFLGGPIGGQELGRLDPAVAAAQTAMVTNRSLTRSDNDLKNYFAIWPNNAGAGASSGPFPGLQVPGRNPLVLPDRIRRYGFRGLQQEVIFVPFVSGVTNAVATQQQAVYLETCARLAEWAAGAFGDMHQMYSGQITTVGNNVLTIGEYMDLYIDPKSGRALAGPSSGSGTRMLYVEGIKQVFDATNPNSIDWTTQYFVTRGIDLP